MPILTLLGSSAPSVPGVPHDPGPITELSPGGYPGAIYTFTVDADPAIHNPGPFTQLSPCGVPMGLYGEFNGEGGAGPGGLGGVYRPIWRPRRRDG